MLNCNVLWGTVGTRNSLHWLLQTATRGQCLRCPFKRRVILTTCVESGLNLFWGLALKNAELRCDNENVMRQLQTLTQRVLLKHDLKVTLAKSKVGGPWFECKCRANCSSCEATCFVPMSYPLASWAFRHSAWLLNRFVPRSGMAPYKLVHGKPFANKKCAFGEPVMCWCGKRTERFNKMDSNGFRWTFIQ